MQATHVRRGDVVGVITGRERGKRGKVLRVLTDKGRVVVEHVNMVKKHTKPSAAGAGSIQNEERPIHASNVALLDPKSQKATRVGFKVAKDGTKTRIARKSGEAIA